MANQQRPPLAAGDDHANPAQIDEAYEALDGMKRIEPCTPVEACDWLQIRPERYPRWAQAVLERELEAISRMARAFRNRDDKESVALVRQIDARCAQLRGGSRPGARLPSARACEYEKPDALEIGSSAPGLTSSTGAWPVIEVSRQPTDAPEIGYASICKRAQLPTVRRVSRQPPRRAGKGYLRQRGGRPVKQRPQRKGGGIAGALRLAGRIAGLPFGTRPARFFACFFRGDQTRPFIVSRSIMRRCGSRVNEWCSPDCVYT
jgi:hypothetical protein